MYQGEPAVSRQEYRR